MMWVLFFAITLGLAMVAAQEQCSSEDASMNSQLAREYGQ